MGSKGKGYQDVVAEEWMKGNCSTGGQRSMGSLQRK